MTTVINIKDAPKDWVHNPNYVYIGRPRVIEGVQFNGYWGNPVLLSDGLCRVCGRRNVHTAKGSTLECYTKDLTRRIREDDEFVKRLIQLHDKILVCFCKPGPCHGDVLAQMADEQYWIQDILNNSTKE